MEFIVTTAIRKMASLKMRKKVIQGGTSAGKTFGILPLLINDALMQPLLEISVVSESVPHLKRGALKDFKKIMRLTGRWNEDQFNKSDLKYTFLNGSYIEFFSVENDDKVRGARRNVLYVNEANNIPFETFNQLSIRTSGSIWVDYNPTAEFWVHRELIGKDDVDFVILTYKDNEALPKNIVEDIESAKDKAKTSAYWANWWNVYGLGLVGNLEGACIPEWSELDTLPTNAKGELECRLLAYGMDFGYSNDPSTLLALYKWNDAYVVDEVIFQKGLSNSELSNLFKTYNVEDVVYADSADPKSIAELCAYGHIVMPATKGRDSILFGINLINQNKIHVTKRSTNLIKELRSYVWMKDKEGNKINKPIDAYNHAIDALRYVFTSVAQNPNYKEYHVW